MIRLGLRLTLNGGREAAIRFAITAAAVGVGVAMLLITLAGLNAVNSQNARYVWLNSGYAPHATTAPTTVDPVWWQLGADTFDGKTIGRVDVAATGPNAPLPPGFTQLPGPGQFVVSPAMAKLLAQTPAAQLGDRYPGQDIATIGRAGLPAPTSLIIVIGHPLAELANAPHATRVTDFHSAKIGGCECYALGVNPNGIDLILGVVIGALLFPVLVFVGSATRLSAARREQRFAAMRLVGATPRQISVVSAVESGAAAILGVVIGFALFFPLRPPVATIPFTGDPFFTSDLSLNLVDILVVAIGIPLAAVAAARFALRRVQITPLGVTRRVTPAPPRAYRLLPLIAGIAELTYFVIVGRPTTTNGQVAAYLGGMLVVMAGLIIAGPWLTMLGARFIARRTSRPSVLLAGRRMGDNPKAAFRAMSGLILALFVATVAVGVITTIVHFEGHAEGGSFAEHTLVDDFSGIDPHATRPAYDPALVAHLRAVPGVDAVTTIHVDPATIGSDQFGPPSGVVSCAELAQMPYLGRCPDGASSVMAAPDIYGNDFGNVRQRLLWPAATYSPAAVDTLPAQTLIIGTNGSTSAIEQARTLLDRAYPLQAFSPTTVNENRVESARQIAAYQQLADVVILTSLPIAGCSLAVSVSGGLTERKRPFSLLRLAGTPISVLRRVVAFESLVPLLLGATVAIGAGLLAAQLFLTSQLHYTLQAPHLAYYVTVAIGLLISLGIVAATLPLLNRITGPETARND